MEYLKSTGTVVQISRAPAGIQVWPGWLAVVLNVDNSSASLCSLSMISGRLVLDEPWRGDVYGAE